MGNPNYEKMGTLNCQNVQFIGCLQMFVPQTFLCHNLKCDLATYPCGGRVGVAIADAGERDLDIGLKVDPQRR